MRALWELGRVLAWGIPLLAGCAGAPPSHHDARSKGLLAAAIGPGADGRWRVCTNCGVPTIKTVARTGTSANATPERSEAGSPWPALAAGPTPGRVARRLERAIVVFSAEDAVLPQVAQDRLVALLPVLRRAVRVRALGFTDDQGVQPGVDVLARQRAQAVVDFLGRHLSTPETPQWVVGGQGGCCYLTHNRTESGRMANRRVELLIELDDSSDTEGLVRSHHGLLMPWMPGQGNADASG